MSPTLVAFLFLVVALVGALPPLYPRWSHLGLHRLVSVAAGIFLGSIFLHLLPELTHGHAEHDGPSALHEEPSVLPWVFVLAGFLLLFTVERVWLQKRPKPSQANAHALLLSATLVGLSLHAFSFGLGLGAIVDRLTHDWPLLVSLLIHKAAETFSLGVVMSLAQLSRTKALVYLVLFAMIEPAAILLGFEFASHNHWLAPLLSGFACGTFLYVAVCDLLPEVFHDSEQGWGKLGWLLLGIFITALSLHSAEGLTAHLWTVLEASLAVFVRMAPYLVLGFLSAGFLHELVKPERLSKHLGPETKAAVVKAALIGAPLPLCSCSVLPVALSLRRAGASRGATSAFLIATPETGVDSLSVSWVLLDPWLTVLRPLGAILSAIATGLAVLFFGGKEKPTQLEQESPPEASAHSCCGHATLSQAPAPPLAQPPRSGLLARALRYGFVNLLDDLAPALLVGLVLSGIIESFLPSDLFQLPWLDGFGGMLVMLVVGVPLYVCASASTPIAAALLLKGLSPGAAFVFLLAGPATNLTSLAVVGQAIGKRMLAVHIAALATITLLLGMAVNGFYALLGHGPDVSPPVEHDHALDWLGWSLAALLGVLLLASLVRSRLLRAQAPASLVSAAN